MATDKSITFGIKIKADSDADLAASSVLRLRNSINSSQEAIKRYESSFRKLRGSSEEVKTAKEKLKGAINAEKDSISRATVALGKHGTTVLDTSKKLQEHQSVVEKVKDSWATFRNAAIVAAFVAIAGAIAGAAVSLAKWVFESANVFRSQGLAREALGGSAEEAKRMGHQLDALTTKVPQTRDELQKLYLQIYRANSQTAISGQGIVDTLNTVAQAASAMGDEAGSKLQEIITRGKLVGRLQLGRNELAGTGLEQTGIGFEDIAKQLSKNLKIGLDDARRQLAVSGVNINEGAKAIRQVTERQLGGINLRKMLDLNVISAKFKDTLANLTKDVNLEPLLEGISKLAGLFSTSSVTGAVLKDMITRFGNATVSVFTKATPFIEKFFTQFLIEILKMENSLLRAAIYLKKTFGIDLTKALGDGSVAIKLAKGAVVLLTAAVLAFGVAIGAAVASTYALYEVLFELPKAVGDFFAKTDWKSIGVSIVQGIIDGFKAAGSNLVAKVRGMADEVKNAFKSALQIHSPSRVFEDYGKQTAAGYAKGLEGSKAMVSAPLRTLVDIPETKGVKGGGPVNLTMNVNVNGGAGPQAAEQIKQALLAPSFRSQMTKVLEEMLRSAGVPTQQGAL